MSSCSAMSRLVHSMASCPSKSSPPIRITRMRGIWLPSYFASWAGGSLALADPNPFAIADHMDALGERVYEPVGADWVALRYGNDYRFRVRLMDLTGGGPTRCERRSRQGRHRPRPCHSPVHAAQSRQGVERT